MWECLSNIFVTHLAHECANLWPHMISILAMYISWMTNLIAIVVEHALWNLHISENLYQICRRNKKTSALAMSNEICFPSAFSAYLLVLQTWNRLITLQQASDYAFQARAQQLKEYKAMKFKLVWYRGGLRSYIW